MSNNMRKFIQWFCLVAAVVSYLGVAGLVIAEVYVRWTLNQNFSFLGGSGLGGLSLLALGQILGLVYLLRSEK